MSKVWYGSLQNRVMENSVNGQPDVEIGMAATITGYSDRRAATVVSWDGKILGVQQDTAKLLNKDGKGIYGNQDYEYTQNPEASVNYFKQDNKGRWVSIYKNSETGRWKMSGFGRLILGVRDEYYDPSF